MSVALWWHVTCLTFMQEAGYRHDQESVFTADYYVRMSETMSVEEIWGKDMSLMHCFRYVSCPVADTVPAGHFFVQP